MGYGVIGSPADSGSVSLGSSPSTPAKEVEIRWILSELVGFRGLTSSGQPARAPLCSGLARRPLKAVARVRIPSGLPSSEVPLISRDAGQGRFCVCMEMGLGQPWGNSRKSGAFKTALQMAFPTLSFVGRVPRVGDRVEAVFEQVSVIR